MSQFEIKDLSEADLPQWDALLAASPEGSIYSDPRYLEALSSARGARFRLIGLYRSGELDGGLAYLEQPSPGGPIVSPRLLQYYQGPVLRRYATKYPSEQTSRHTAALGTLADHLAARSYGAVVLKSPHSLTDARAFLERGWSVWPSYTYVVPLDDLGRQWERVERNLRRQIKRCEETEKLVLAADDDFDSFYRLHETTLTRKRAAAYLPKARFAKFFETLRAQGLARILHARRPDGLPVATQLVLLGPYATSHTVCAGGDPQFGRSGAQAFLRWKAFEHLAGLGYAANDLTDAALNPVTHFKSQFGGELKQTLVIEAPHTVRYALVAGASNVASRGIGLARGASRRALRLVGL